MMNATATKNGATFKTFNTREGVSYDATCEEFTLEVHAHEDFYLAALVIGNKPQIYEEGATASFALSRLAKSAKSVSWTEENFGDKIFALAKDLNTWMKRPQRETYNAR